MTTWCVALSVDQLVTEAVLIAIMTVLLGSNTTL
jgi:hypothetical protein